MCMDKRNEFRETFVYFSQMKRYLRLSKNLQFCELRYPMCIICIRRGTNIVFEASVRTLQKVVCIEKSKWKHKFMNYVTVNYVTAILLKSKYLSKCIH